VLYDTLTLPCESVTKRILDFSEVSHQINLFIEYYFIITAIFRVQLPRVKELHRVHNSSHLGECHKKTTTVALQPERMGCETSTTSISSQSQISHKLDPPNTLAMTWAGFATTRLNVTLKGSQKASLFASHSGFDSIIIQGTGTGKSVCFQLPVVMLQSSNSFKILRFRDCPNCCARTTPFGHFNKTRNLGRFLQFIVDQGRSNRFLVSKFNIHGSTSWDSHPWDAFW
jgi:hypothetical protein